MLICKLTAFYARRLSYDQARLVNSLQYHTPNKYIQCNNYNPIFTM